ncbi:hypothetical protein SAMN05444392_101332 [Seinonella peptonophila]|uniref:Uncharacterized protein n=1 Tax=Seinonella peptonophila TaxID=112248 RepID=A0A1M4T6C7_9BACL|nr:hypothetical protein [Seinonella peptonophila]SHE40082.1 hypothetical protein SAMN05444392_101332 [Seinonella peptonophila]
MTLSSISILIGLLGIAIALNSWLIHKTKRELLLRIEKLEQQENRLKDKP